MTPESRLEYPPLCGGTFFSIMIPYRGERVSPKRYYEKIKDPKSDIPTLISLICVAKPEFENSLPSLNSITTYTSQFRNCRKNVPNGLYISRPDYRASFNDQMDNSYKQLLWRMHAFLDGNIELYNKNGTPKTIEMKQLVLEIMELISNDPACKDQSFRIGPNGEMMNPFNTETIHFQSFMLGIWYYIVVEHPDNNITQSIYDSWNANEDKGHTIKASFDLVIQDIPSPEEAQLEDESSMESENANDQRQNDAEHIDINDVEVTENDEDHDDRGDRKNHISDSPQIIQNFANFGNGPQIANNNGIIILGNK